MEYLSPRYAAYIAARSPLGQARSVPSHGQLLHFFSNAAGPEDRFPQYVFIEPSYGGTDENDQHPPTDMRKGEYLIAQVYNALRRNEALWNSTLFVLLYDEHGGFYGHVVPPKATPPDLNSLRRCVEYHFGPEPPLRRFSQFHE